MFGKGWADEAKIFGHTDFARTVKRLTTATREPDTLSSPCASVSQSGTGSEKAPMIRSAASSAPICVLLRYR